MAWLEKRNGTYFVCHRVGGRTRRIKAYADKTASTAKLNRFTKDVAMGKEGLVDPFADHREAQISDHLGVWVSEIRKTGSSEYYANQCNARINRLIRECGWEFLGDISPESFIQWRSSAVSEISHNAKDKAKAKTGPMGPRTQNHYLVTLVSFCRWCVKRKRTDTNPVSDVQKVDQAGDVRRKRRALTAEQVAALLAAVPQAYRLLYRLLLSTGLRRAEAEQLQWGDIRTEGGTHFVQLRAETTKANRADALPLIADLAKELSAARGPAPDSARVFSRVPRIKEHRKWLAAAKIPYTDDSGRRVDIHALRHTYGTLLSKAGVSPREAMSLMRHTDLRLTMNVYTDPKVFNLAAAVEKLPATLTGEPKVANRVATGGMFGHCTAPNGTNSGGAIYANSPMKTAKSCDLAVVPGKAGEGGRTLDIHVGNVTLYH